MTTIAVTEAPPQTRGIPLVGSLPALLMDPFRYLLDAQARYGDIYTLDLGVTKVVVVNHPRHVQHVFVDRVDNYNKGGGFWDAVRTLLGNGLPVSEGDLWLRQRRLMQPQFHRQRLAGLTTLMVDAIDDALSTWQRPASSGEPLDLCTAFNELTMKVVTRSLFGTGLTAAEMDAVGRALVVALDYMVRGIVQSALPTWAPAPGRRKHRQAIAVIDSVLYRIIGECRRGGARDTLLAMLVDATDESGGGGMTDQQLRDEVASLFLAGYETTSLALSWAWAFLTQRDDLAQRLYDEVESVLGARRPTFDDAPKLTFTRALLQETLRLRPSAWQVTRTAVADDEIDGFHIAAGTQILIPIYGVHHHPEVWPRPTEFDPDRFGSADAGQRHKMAWIPFGAGQRVCIGRDFAMIEGQLALAMVAQRFRLRSLRSVAPRPRLSTTLRPSGGVEVVVSHKAEIVFPSPSRSPSAETSNPFGPGSRAINPAPKSRWLGS